MSAVVAVPPVKPGDQSTPSASPAAPAAVEFRYTQTDSFVELLHQLGASLLVSTYQANKLLVVRRRRRRALHAGADVRQADGPGRRRRPAGPGHPQGGLVPAQRPGHRPARRARRPARRLLPAALRARHRGHRRPRTRLGGGGAVGGQHALLVPVYAAPRLQLRAAVAAAVRHRLGRRGPLPSERPGHRGRPAQVRHRPGRDRHGRRLAGQQAPGRLPDGGEPAAR